MKTDNEAKKGFLYRVERLGNALPHPIYIFVVLSVVVMAVSGLYAGREILNPSNGEVVLINSLVNRDGIIWILKNIVNNFIKFPPLGMVLVTMLGIGLAEETGFLKTALKVCIMGAPLKLVTCIVIFAGIMGNVAGSAVFIIIPPLGALIFKSLGKHPVAGLAAGYIGVAGGLSANLLITPTDVINAGITDVSAKIYDSGFSVNPSANWYFMIASTVLLTVLGALIIDRFIEPRLGDYVEPEEEEEQDLKPATALERKALKMAGIALLIYVGLILLTILPHGILRSDDNKLVPSPFLDSMIPILTLLFMVPSTVYGVVTKVISNKDDFIRLLTKALSGLSGFVLLCFFSAQFVSFFSYTNLGVWLSISGAEWLESCGLTGIPLILLFILFCTFANFFIGSLSAKWTVLAPIFVPMFMKLGMTPFFTQAAFRIADSVTNPISPLEPFMPFIIICMQKYNKKYGLGSVISVMLPLTIGYLIFWSILLIVWYKFNLPLGPGAGIHL